MSHSYSGNSISSFSAYMLLSRSRRAGGFASRDFNYNGGRIPLAEVLFKRVIERQSIDMPMAD